MSTEVPAPPTPPEVSPPAPPEDALVVRFTRPQRVLHVTLMVSFLGLAFTGLPLLFADAPWAMHMAGLFGGYGVTGNLHRLFGFVMLVTFGTHVATLLRRLYGERDYSVLWGPDSLVPQPSDLVQMVLHFRWFVGLGPRPRFDRFTYWEKFDYWAVFWGMGIIGTSGLLLAFPRLFSWVVPGWVFNVAFLVHGEEALLAMVFIFTVHFFNGHLRPEKFPMDTVIFSGRISVHELKHERPAQYDRLLAAGILGDKVAPPEDPRVVGTGRAIGTVAVLLGLVMTALTAYALSR